MSLSVCILVNQWHPKLPEVIASYQNCASEILLGANGDFEAGRYPELKRIPILRIIPLAWEGYGRTKNKLAEYAKSDWILSVDADEVANKKLQSALDQMELDRINRIYAIKMLHFLGDTPLRFGAWGKGKKHFLRVYNRNFTAWNEADVHESIIRPANAIITPLSGKIYHYTSESYEQLIKKNRLYARLSAEKYFKQGKSNFWAKNYISAVFLFLKEYFLYLGFMDGMAGWKVAKGNALYTFWKYDLLSQKQSANSHL